MCEHRRRDYFRVIISDGRTQYAERCLDCGANPNPGRPWVSLALVARAVARPDDLPVLEDMRRPPGEQQGDLFS